MEFSLGGRVEDGDLQFFVMDDNSINLSLSKS